MPNPNDPSAADPKPIRVTIQHPFLSHYRVPVFRQLAQRPGIKLLVVYGHMPNMPNVDPDGFDGRYEPLEIQTLMGKEIMWCGTHMRYVSKKRSDVMVLMWNTRYLSLVPALIKAKFTGVKTILWGHGCSKTETGLRSMLRQTVAKLGDALLLYNHTVAQRYRDYGWPAERVYVGLNSLDQTAARSAREKWSSDPAKLDAFRKEHDLDKGPYIFFVSRLDPANRLDLLVTAVAGLKDKHPGLQALIVGKGEDERKRLETLAESLGVTDNIRFLGAIYGEEQLAPYFMSSTVFCYPSNMGLSILHAFGYGLPVICGDKQELMGPEVEALKDGENGLFFRHGDADSLAQALDRVLSDPRLASKMADGARATIDNQFNINTMVTGIEDAIRYCASIAR
jgi:glycosyltransferase involved in cell wall biosynthesis